MLTYVNGKFLPSEKAAVSVEDRGFRFGDSVFETIAVYEGIPYQLELHMERLKRGLKNLKIEHSVKNLSKTCHDLINKNRLNNGILRIIISRGCGSRGYLPLKTTPTVVIQTYKSQYRSSGSVTIMVSSVQKVGAKSIPAVKHGSALASVLARIESEENGVADAIMLTEKKQISETSSGNIFWFNNKILYTPSLAASILPGTTRAAIIRLSPYKVKEGLFDIRTLLAADEIFLSNSVWKLLPVTKILGHKRTWKSFRLTNEISELLEDDIKKYVSRRKKKVG